jgi:hypothetical protein
MDLIQCDRYADRPSDMVSGVNQVLVDVFAMQGPSASSSFFGPDFRQLPCEANICRKRQEAILFWEFSEIRLLTRGVMSECHSLVFFCHRVLAFEVAHCTP